ncbi:MAG: apolipoprotein N-acyltransferase [Ignavibacteria bacterium]|nr:apolipoprotein N-acyltransferase [Ignavibacteria bacterium]
MNIYLLACFGGALLALGFSPVSLFILPFVGFVPLFFALERTSSRKQRVTVMYLFFFIFHGIGNWWVSSWQPNADPYLMISGIALWLGHPFFFMVPIVAYRFIRRRLGLTKGLFVFPFVWTAFEWVHSLSDASYPWLSLGYTQIDFLPYVQIADITGVWGITFLVALVNSITAYWIVRYREDASISESSLSWKFYVIRGAITVSPVIILPLIYGLIQLPKYAPAQSLQTPHKINVAVIQPNINPWQKWESDTYEQVLLHLRIQDSLASRSKFDLALWSETSIPYLGMKVSSEHHFGFLQRELVRSNAALLTGFSEIVTFRPSPDAPPMAKPLRGDPNLLFAAHNSAILLLPDSTESSEYPIHRKMRLTLFAEYIPFVEVFPVMIKWLEWGVGISNWMKGKEQMPLPLALKTGDTARIGCIICIESIYPDFVRNYSVKGANMLVVITNDAWYNHTFGPAQHYEIAAMRAIESRRAIARCANTGISGFIAPSGSSYSTARQYQSVGMAQEIPLVSDMTLYVRFGDWFPELGFGITIIALLLSGVRRIRTK